MPVGDNETIIAWKSKGLLDVSVSPLITRGNSLAPKLKWIHNSKRTVEFIQPTNTGSQDVSRMSPKPSEILGMSCSDVPGTTRFEVLRMS